MDIAIIEELWNRSWLLQTIIILTTLLRLIIRNTHSFGQGPILTFRLRGDGKSSKLRFSIPPLYINFRPPTVHSPKLWTEDMHRWDVNSPCKVAFSIDTVSLGEHISSVLKVVMVVWSAEPFTFHAIPAVIIFCDMMTLTRQTLAVSAFYSWCLLLWAYSHESTGAQQQI